MHLITHAHNDTTVEHDACWYRLTSRIIRPTASITTQVYDVLDRTTSTGTITTITRHLRTDSTDSPDCLPILLRLSVFTF